MIEQSIRPADDDPVLTIKDLASRTRLSEGFIYEQAIKGIIEHYAFGGSRRKRGAIRFSERQYRQFLSNQLDHCQPVTGPAVSQIQAGALTRQPNTTTRTLNQLLSKKRA